MRVFKVASATITVDDKEYDPTQLGWPEIVMPAVFETTSRILNVTFKLTIIGPFQFKRREQLLNLARYTRWPYTN